MKSQSVQPLQSWSADHERPAKSAVGPHLAVATARTDQHDDSGLNCLAIVVIDGDLKVKFTCFNGAQGEEVRDFLCDRDFELRAEIIASLSPLLAVARKRTAFMPLKLNGDLRLLGVSVMGGSDDGLFALVVEADYRSSSLSRAAARFGLTRRQTEVLALILEGASAYEIAQSLQISEYTAQGYVKSLLVKTGSRNRAVMATRVLAWRDGGA